MVWLILNFGIKFQKTFRGKIMSIRIGKILEVGYAIEKSSPPNLVVRAKAQVPTLGYTFPVLNRRTYVTPPADGVWEYDFYAEPPTGIVGQMLDELEAIDVWVDYDEMNVKGVRVYGTGDGIVEKLFNNE